MIDPELVQFLSTPSARRATTCPRRPAAARWYFYPRPPRGGRHLRQATLRLLLQISIHALREEGDSDERTVHRRFDPISIHALREEGDGKYATAFWPIAVFLSTPSARRATSATIMLQKLLKVFLSTPSARRATRAGRCHHGGHQISIHALREEGDERCLCRRCPARDFYPRPPRGGRLDLLEDMQTVMVISIHALREEGDERKVYQLLLCRHFYPRPPRGGRPQTKLDIAKQAQFLSTPSARRATSAPLTSLRTSEFLSTPSARRATPGARQIVHDAEISIHALREEGDFRMPPSLYHSIPFLSTPSARRATVLLGGEGQDHALFLSTPSARRATMLIVLLEGDR